MKTLKSIVVISLVGVGLFPAVASASTVETELQDVQVSNTLGGDPAVPVEVSPAEQIPQTVSAPSVSGPTVSFTQTSVPGSSLGSSLLQAALSQVGINQDCTDLVQNSLAAIGLTLRRDQGGKDFGTDDVAYTFGTRINPADARPGDIATIGPANGGHVWIILDPASNTGVHGNWLGTTAVGNAGVPISQHAVYRL